MLEVKKGLTLLARMSSGNYGTMIVGRVTENTISCIILPALDPRKENIYVDQWGGHRVDVKTPAEFEYATNSGVYSPLEKEAFSNLNKYFKSLMVNPVEQIVKIDEKQSPSNFKIMIENQKIEKLYQ